MPEPSFLTFLYVGASKSGSTWLAEVLSEHPDVFIPPAKDIMYFDRHYDEPLAWYRKFFPAPGTFQHSGEVCHNYFDHPEAAQRIHRDFPDVKLIIFMRDPVDRTFSQWLLEKAYGIADKEFLAFCRRPDIVGINDYRTNLERYFSRFPREQILVVYFDELVKDSRAVARKVFSFLGVSSECEVPSAGRRVLKARKARVGAVGTLLYAGAQYLRKLGGANLVGLVKRNPLFDRLFYKELSEKPAMPREGADWLFAQLSPAYDEIGRISGRPVPDSWRIPPAARKAGERV